MNDSSQSALPRCLVVGIDSDGYSDDAVRAALELGPRIGAAVDLVHALPLPDFLGLGFEPTRAAAITEILLERATGNVIEHVDALVRPRSDAGGAAETSAGRATPLSSPPSTRSVDIVVGHPAEVLLRRAHAKKGWIVLGQHKKRGVFDFGSTARAVLAQAPAAVWVQRTPPRPIARILVPIDLSEDSLRALSLARSLAQSLAAGVCVLHCFDASRFFAAAGLDYGAYATIGLEDVRAQEQAEFTRATGAFDWQGVAHSAEFQDGQPAHEIVGRSRASDLIVMGTHGRTGLASVVLGSVAYSVLKRSDCPVLALRRPERAFLV